MTKVQFTPFAQSNLLDIWTHIAEDSLEAADNVVEDLRSACDKLASMPEMGFHREDLADKRHRFWPIHSHLIVYRPGTQPLQIVAIVHGARELGAFFESLRQDWSKEER